MSLIGFVTVSKKFVFVFQLSFSFKNNRRTNILLVGIFENALKKVVDHQKHHFGSFWRLIIYSIVRLLFLQMNQKKMKEKKLVDPRKSAFSSF